MLEESDRAWDKVATRSYAFHALRDECAHLRVLSLQQVGGRAGGGCSERGPAWPRARDGGSFFGVGPAHAVFAQQCYALSSHTKPALLWPVAYISQPVDMLAPLHAVPVPIPQVRDFYATYFAPGSPTRRKLSLHIVGKAHTAELAEPAPEGVQLVERPQDLGKQLPLWPAMLGDARAAGR